MKLFENIGNNQFRVIDENKMLDEAYIRFIETRKTSYPWHGDEESNKYELKENFIRRYRESKILNESVEDKIKKLNDMDAAFDKLNEILNQPSKDI
jgi:hypothetical protein